MEIPAPERKKMKLFAETIKRNALLTAISTFIWLVMHDAIYLFTKTEKRLYTKITMNIRVSKSLVVVIVLLLAFYTAMRHIFGSNCVTTSFHRQLNNIFRIKVNWIASK